MREKTVTVRVGARWSKCRRCGRRSTLLLQWDDDAYTWSCWRPWHWPASKGNT